MSAETSPPKVEIAQILTEAERDDFRANLRQNLGYRAWVIEDTMLGHVERIVAARLAGVIALADLYDEAGRTRTVKPPWAHIATEVRNAALRTTPVQSGGGA